MSWSDAARRAALEARRRRRQLRKLRGPALKRVKPTFTQKDVLEYAEQYSREEMVADLARLMARPDSNPVDIANIRLVLAYLS